MILNEGMKSDYKNNGYLIVKQGINTGSGHHYARLEQAIDGMASSIETSREEYLRAVCRWDSPNDIVIQLVNELAPKIKPMITELLERENKIVRSSIIRKHSEAGKPTHGHQDSGYWLKNASQTYDISSWIALENVDENNGALRVIPGSHLQMPEAQQDFLSKYFEDPAMNWGDSAITVKMSAGDILLFSPGLWHASHSCSEGQTRSSLVIRWTGNPPIFEAVNTHTIESGDSSEFGMSSSGRLLSQSLTTILKIAGHPVPKKRENLIRAVLDHNLTRLLPDPKLADATLNKLLILTKAKAAHNGNDLGASVWEDIRDLIVEPSKTLFEANGNE